MLFTGHEPKKATKGAAGFDLISNVSCLIAPGKSATISTGTCVAINPGYFGLVTLRSGHGFKKNLMCHIGVIDSDYRGDIAVKLFNMGDEGVVIERGERFAQLLLLDTVPSSFFTQVSSLDDTERGEGGFGSTGDK